MKEKRILIVTGDASIQKMLTDLLNVDYECVSVQNGEEGLSYLEENIGGVDLVIMDLQIPAVNEFEMLQWIGNNPVHKNISVLILAELERMEEITHAFDIGVDDVISKPLNPVIAKKRVDNMMYISGNKMVHNVMEDLIWEGIEESIDTLGVCSCPVCRRDLLTMTLNKVPPKYVTTEKGKTIAKAQSQASRDEKIKLLTELAYCAELVKKKPRHG